MPTFPQISLNGTAASVLLEETVAAKAKVEEARQALIRIRPHARDYQHKPDAFHFAHVEHEQRITSLVLIATDLDEIAEHLADHL